MADINFGKQVLESLTIGMYSDPMTIYREYIQNSTDGIDKAVKSGIIGANEGVIHVVVDKHKRKIEVEDNGSGVSAEVAYNDLFDIGNSEKNSLFFRYCRCSAR